MRITDSWRTLVLETVFLSPLLSSSTSENNTRVSARLFQFARSNLTQQASICGNSSAFRVGASPHPKSSLLIAKAS